MRIVEINMVPFGSTGRIMFQIADCVKAHGDDVRTYATYIASKRYIKPPQAPEGHRYYGSYLGNTTHAVLARLTGKNCYYSKRSTKRLIADIEDYQPDIIHLHNLHAAYINFPIFFDWLKKSGKRVIWTFHDCWPFTGKCPYFELCGCDRWKTGCHDCPQLSQYPSAHRDVTRQLWDDKRAWFNGLEHLHIVTPSKWLADTVKQSFLKTHPVTVINNGIDLSFFHPTPSDFRRKYNCEDKFLLLGVASPWGYRKGLDVFIELAKRLEDAYQIVLVGTTEEIDKNLPAGIISIHRTESVNRLAELYSAADLFVNPTRDETFGLVNAEALACGTPIITFRSGGSPEVIDERSGLIVDRDDVDAMESAIHYVRRQRPFAKEDCIARAKLFDKMQKYQEYYSLYCNLMRGDGGN